MDSHPTFASPHFPLLCEGYERPLRILLFVFPSDESEGIKSKVSTLKCSDRRNLERTIVITLLKSSSTKEGGRVPVC